MTGRRFAGVVLASVLLAPGACAARATPPAKPAPPAPAGVPLLPGGGSKEPVNIAADKLDYFDKDQKLIYTGNVVVVQGDSSLKASVLTIYLRKQDAPAGGATPTPPVAGPVAGGSSVRHMDAEGPVTLISKDQVGTGDSATYDKDQNQVTLTGNVTLSQGTNVTKGERLIYDMTSGQAQVFSGATAPRVVSVFTPGSGAPGGPAEAGKGGAKKDKAAGSKKAGAGSKPGPTALQ